MIHSSKTSSQAHKEAKEYLEGWQRARAELDNFRKKVREEEGRRHDHSVRVVVEPLLSLADNFHAIIQHVPAELADNAWTQGVLHVSRQLDTILASYNVNMIEAKAGDHFDAALHEAIDQIATKDVPSGAIVEVIQAGYRLGDTILRPVKVKVSM